MDFILNDRLIHSDEPTTTIMLDFIRVRQRLMGTKIGCREGDCGACTILVGELHDKRIRYRTMTSCLMPLGNANGKHIVTIEGLNLTDLTPVQKAMIENSATQCGFCTVGFVVSLVGFCLSDKATNTANAIASVDGNICRCTGYKSIERAAASVASGLNGLDPINRLERLVAYGYLPTYFLNIAARLADIPQSGAASSDGAAPLIAGGTDLYVQRPDSLAGAPARLSFDTLERRQISLVGQTLTIGCGATVEDLRIAPLLQQQFPRLMKHTKLISSTPIRNMATIGGNFVNASPIGDMTIFFLALDGILVIRKGEETRELPLSEFYKGYKDLDLAADEILESICIQTFGDNDYFNFEKVSKRTHLDIASVNSALFLRVVGKRIKKAVLSAGGVAPVPLYLAETSRFMVGRSADRETFELAARKALEEVSPISDARGSADYKRLLLRQLVYAHFYELFPELATEEVTS